MAYVTLNETDFYEFLKGYRDAMLWANTMEYRGEEGDEDPELVSADDALDRVLDEELTISPETWANAERECQDFLEAIIVDEVLPVTDDEPIPSILWPYTGGREVAYGGAALAGHDFALTRNHHGAGFWDRGLGEVGDALTMMAQAYGSQDWIIEGDVVIGD